MNTKLQALAVGALEAVLLLGVGLVPVFVNYYSFRVFEPDKAALLWSLALLGALAGLVVVVEARGRGLAGALRDPLVVGALLLGVATTLATLTTTLRPRIGSLLGSDERAMGLLTLLACLLLFAAATYLAREPERRGRLVATLILASVPAALVAILQGLGMPLVQGIVESNTRVFGTLSNPIFLGGFLMMVAPLTLARLVTPGGTLGRRLGLGLILAAQVVALVLSVSRGPQLGFVAALVVLGVAWGVASGRRALAWSAVGLAVAGVLFLALFNLPGTPLAALKNIPVVGRFGRITDTAAGSEAARMSMWRGVDVVLASDPARLVTGYGPESLKYVLIRNGQVGLGGRGQADRLVDRAHNVLLDALSMTGILGALALLLVFGAWLFGAARAAGLVPDATARRLLAGLLIAGPLVGAAAWLVPGSSPFAGATTLLGLAVGLGIYLLVALVRRGADSETLAFDPLPGALLAIGVAVVVEAAFGIQTVVTQTVFWALAGLVVALTARGSTAAAAERALAAANRATPGTVTLSWTPGAGALGVVAGALASALTYSYFIRGVNQSSDILALAFTVILLTLAAGAALAADQDEPVSGFLLTAVPVWLVYFGLHWLAFQMTGDAAQVFAVTLWWFLALAILAGWWLRAKVPAKAAAVQPLAAGVYLVLAIAASTAVFVVAIRPIQASIYFQSAMANFGQALAAQDNAAGDAARILFDRAVTLRPDNDVYYAQWSEMYTRLATQLTGQPALTAFQQAENLIAHAEQLDPDMPYHTFNRGHLQLLAVESLPPEQRAAVATNAVVALEQAFNAVKASDPQIANELALAKLLAGDTKGALNLLDLSLKLDPDKVETYALEGRALEAADRLDEAKAALETAMQRGKSGPDVLIALGELSRKQNNLQQAADYYQQAVDTRQVRDWQVFFNLGLLYRDIGQFEKALQFLQVALSGAPQDQQAAVQQALDEAVSRRAGNEPAPGPLPGNPAPGQPGSPFGGPTPSGP
jgi:tetratricopeptide (TPR) repeat protein/O-antigen ligase